MTETIRVVRVEGRLLPDPRPGHDFVGLRRYREKTDPPEAIVYRIPDGPAYVDDGPQELAETWELRKALRKGDVSLAPPNVVESKPARRGREERTG